MKFSIEKTNPIQCFSDVLVGVKRHSGCDPCCNQDLLEIGGFTRLRNVVLNGIRVKPVLTKQILICVKRSARKMKNEESKKNERCN